METVVLLPDSEPPNTISEVLEALRECRLEPIHQAKSWGDWIHLNGFRTVISIESMRGLTSSATIEHADGEEDGEPAASILHAFAQLGWQGIDDEGPYALG